MIPLDLDIPLKGYLNLFFNSVGLLSFLFCYIFEKHKNFVSQ